ncbi:hypothetical protein HER32_15130 [Hymenobacter sp. BT18]|uniref:hypothetical protein n=1 Tax=Hymenobacter sp. BT18 TaxID=2835648 RepID=UPI00143E23A9|nr:hypothetical protein [Hymenobacter sp. BT18]QIX62440.1 hypothetical protein HER32_15130 [Hymenobacter sp. BT18]
MSDSAPRPQADEEWEDLLRQWREQPAPQPRPYFYSRVRARLISETAAPQLQRTWVRWPAYAVMLGIVLLLSGDGAALPSADRDAPPETPLTGR